MTADKFILPLSITASVIGIWLYIRGGVSGAPVQGSLPLPASIPSFAQVPAITYNVSTPTSSAGANSSVPSIPGFGFVYPGSQASNSQQFGRQHPLPSGSCCGCGPNASGSWDSGITYEQTVQGTSSMIDTEPPYPHVYLNSGVNSNVTLPVANAFSAVL